MKLLYGTGNPAKLAAMRHRLKELNVALIGLADLAAEGMTIPNVPEDGETPLENARQKALAYYEAFHIPVFSCDSGLYFDNVPDEIQPGVHVRTVAGHVLSDEQMLAYYSGLAKQYGPLIARYKNAICFIADSANIYEAMAPSMESERFILSNTPHSGIRKSGFPLDCLSIDIKTNQYYYDLPTGALEQVAVGDGFLLFFRRVFGALKEKNGDFPAMIESGGEARADFESHGAGFDAILCWEDDHEQSLCDSAGDVGGLRGSGKSGARIFLERISPRMR